MKNKNKKSKQVENGTKPNTNDEGIWKDPRFAHLVNDPRFKKLPQAERKVKIDKRFQSMFTNDKFKVKYTVDKYGRPAVKSTSEDLRKFYEINSEDEDVVDDKEKLGSDDESIKESGKDEFGNDILESEEEITDEIKELIRDQKIDVARGGLLMTDSSDDEDTSAEEEDELFLEHVWGELDREAPKTDESTCRLAVCNMDWDRIRAMDIMVLCNSFLLSNGSILSVKIYPSEYGKQRLAEEDAAGPPELREIGPESSSDDSDEDDGIVHKEEENGEGNEYHMEKLRQYQLNRLKYYYAVIVCDSVATADKLYEECDGLEYESTATKLDLRFIPDEEEFDEDTLKDAATSLPDMVKYQPRIFTTKALQQAKVDLTWDETDINRKELSDKLMSGKLNEVSDAELQKYLAYSSEEDEEPIEQPSISDVDSESNKDKFARGSSINKYKALLNEIKEKEEEKKQSQVERELTWGIDTQHDVRNVQDKEIKQKPKGPELTPFEQIVEKKKAKQKARKEERKAKLKQMNDGDEDSESEDDLPDGIDLNDPYFASEFQNGEFAEKPSQTKKKLKKSAESDLEDAKQVAELKLLLDDPEDNEKSHFSLKQIQESEGIEQSKRKRKKKLKKSRREIEEVKLSRMDDFEIDTNDKRFSAIYSSHHFNIDPTDSHFKKTKGMETIINEKLKRRRQQDVNDGLNEEGEENDQKKQKKDVAVSMLVKSIKRKVGKSVGK